MGSLTEKFMFDSNAILTFITVLSDILPIKIQAVDRPAGMTFLGL